jgi:hypothetical protein
MITDYDGQDQVLPTVGVMIEARDAFARPANATAYDANDVLAESASTTATSRLRGLPLARHLGGGGYLVFWSVSVNDTGMTPRIRVHLYTVTQPTSALNGDNVVFVQLAANAPQWVASFDLPALALSAGAGADMTRATRDDLRIPFVCATNDDKVYYRYELLDADTPAAGDWIRTTARADAN